ncbi:hypothetical protein PM082_007135 [Marasmius tenuissimus]|nr:hypothetical protein PM082_007135 [Marasmius tenuissimus]
MMIVPISVLQAASISGVFDVIQPLAHCKNPVIGHATPSEFRGEYKEAKDNAFRSGFVCWNLERVYTRFGEDESERQEKLRKTIPVQFCHVMFAPLTPYVHSDVATRIRLGRTTWTSSTTNIRVQEPVHVMHLMMKTSANRAPWHGPGEYM